MPPIVVDVVLLAEMLSVLVLALEVMDREAHPLGLTINWAKTKIQNLGKPVAVYHAQLEETRWKLSNRLLTCTSVLLSTSQAAVSQRLSGE